VKIFQFQFLAINFLILPVALVGLGFQHAQAAGIPGTKLASQCEPSDRGMVLFLPVVFAFADGSSRQKDIYQSLAPRIEGWDERPKSITFDVVSGRATFHYCLISYIWEGKPELSMVVGLRRIPLTLRADINPKQGNTTRQVVEHPPIILIDQANPDWLIPLRATFSQTSKGTTVIDFDLLNPAKVGLMGPRIKLIAEKDSGVRCKDAGPTTITTVNFKIAKSRSISKAPQVVTADVSKPSLPQPVENKALIETNVCSFGSRLTVALDDIQPIAADHVAHFRYELLGLNKLFRLDEFASKRLGLRPGFSDIAIQFSSSRTYPESISSK
jgi:hypothetical protein